MCVKKDVVIVGASGFAREILWLLENIDSDWKKFHFWGFIDKDPGERVIGDDTWVCSCQTPLSVIIAIGNGAARHRLAHIYKKNTNVTFPNLIEPSVKYHDSLRMGEGNIICAGTILTTDIEIGDFNILNLNCTVGHGCVIEDYVTINPGCNVSGNVRIGRKCLVGTGATILQTRAIGEGAIIGAGAVVTHDIMPDTINMGVPAKEVNK